MASNLSSKIKFEEKLSILENIFGECDRRGEQVNFFCKEPDCNPDEKKLTVNIGKNVCRCWRCGYGYGDIQYLIRKYGRQYYNKWLDLCGISLRDVSDLKYLIETGIDGGIKEIIREDPVELPPEYVSIAHNWDSILMRAPINYLKNRGFTRRDIIRWQIGFVHTGLYRDRVIFPSFDETGKLNYWIGRKITKCEHRDRYMNPKRDKSQLIFNEFMIDWGAPVVLIEGVFDAAKVARGNAIPTLGSSITEQSRLFKKIVENKTSVIFGFDADAIEKTMKLAKLFESYGISTKEALIDRERDFGAMNAGEVERRIRKSESRSEDDLLRKLLEEKL